MSTSASGERRSLNRRDAVFRLDGAYVSSPAQTTISLSGDVDASAAHVFERYAEMAIRETGNRIDVRLDGVTFFGADASRAVEAVVSLAESHGRNLRISGLPTIAGDVLDVLGIRHPMIDREDLPMAPLSPMVFDAVISRAVLRGREAVCVTTHDVDDPRILFVNEAFTELTGYPADSALGLNPREFQGPLTDRGVIDALKASVRTGGTFNGETVNYRQDGTPFWMNWKIVDVSVGTRYFFLALQRDGTELRQLNRLQGARSRIERVQRVRRRSDMSTVLDALADAVALILESPDAVVTAAVTDPGGNVRATSTSAVDLTHRRYSGTRRRRSLTTTPGWSHVPFELADGWFGHVRIDDVHPDWLILVDESHIDVLTEMAGGAIADRLPQLSDAGHDMEYES